MADNSGNSKLPLQVEGDFSEDFFLVAGRVHEGLSRLTETTLELVSLNPDVDLETLLGKEFRATLIDDRGDKRVFSGICVSIEFAGRTGAMSHYLAELRPWLWFLTRTRECRVFQDQSVVEILDTILGEYGFSGDVIDKLNGTYETREYTIQYRETDFDFLSRLLEEAGIYYFFAEAPRGMKMMLADGVGSHATILRGNPVPYRPLDEAGHGFGGNIIEWASGLDSVSGKVTLADYFFETPRADLKSEKAIPKGDYRNNDREIYDFAGRFRDSALGDERVKVRMEAEAARHKAAAGAANFTGLFVGRNFGVADLPRESDGGTSDWLLSSATHLFQQRIPELAGRGRGGTGVEPLLAADIGEDLYRIQFSAVPSDTQYRAPLTTPWPEMPGIQTAIVTGPAGEEIYVDEYGRIRVKFFWDRKGEDDETCSCWVRCMMPWTGKSWGMAYWPRIGQEVVVQFEQGNPDRPLVVGMLYNADTMPPYPLPDDKTKSGIKTRSSTDGTGFNELMMDDKNGAELVRFQSERDYEQIVKNNADITVGLEHKDKGDMTLKVHRHLTETLDTGNHKFTVAAGTQTLKVKKDKTETVEGKFTQTVTGNVTETIKRGDFAQTLDMGNYSVDVTMGSVAITAAQEIKLTCGGSTITMTPFDIKIKSMMVTVEGDVMVEVKSVLTQVKGSASLILKGGITLIN